jgi:DNA-binding NarL/FixJ family response regulator
MATRALALALCGHADAACTQVCRADEMTSAVEVRVLSATVRAILRPDHERRRAMVDLWELAEILDTWDPLVASIRSSRELAETLADTTSLRTSLAQLFQRSNDLGLARRFGLRARATRRATDLLSPRESEILGLMARGYRNHEIAKALVLSPSTVKVHVRHIYEKLGVRTRSEAVTRLTLSD